MKTKHTNTTQYAKKLQANQNRQQQEEFGSEFEIDAASAQVNNFAEEQGKTDIKQPVSERTAWH
ncbi:hypothetical protein ABFY48_23085 [Lysinibacillus pakistanensis]|uniref:hypothetical protein n=1 Tax=Lysinibacillus pakistanensis TaxID=759811 RepID=UPI003D2AD5FF